MTAGGWLAPGPVAIESPVSQTSGQTGGTRLYGIWTAVPSDRAAGSGGVGFQEGPAGGPPVGNVENTPTQKSPRRGGTLRLKVAHTNAI